MLTNTTNQQISHHLLALYGTGAEPSHLTKAYHNNATYQRPALPPHTTTTTTQPGAPPKKLDFRPFPAAAEPYFGREEYYPDFLRFFQEEIRNLGSWQAVVGRYVLGIGTGTAEAKEEEEEPMLTRLFAGFLHPLIQLMYGVEWNQEAIVAEGLAQAAVHSGDIGAYLLAAEKAAKERRDSSSFSKEGARVVDLLEEVKKHEKLAVAARMEDANKIRDGVLARAGPEMIEIAAKVRVRPDEVEERTAEMFNAALYVAAAAALVKEGKRPKVDFFLM
jgi:hypothetical protein